MPLTRPINNPVPFATSGLKNVIPVPTAFGGAASMTNGFPAETMTPIIAGGTPPAGQDMNGILYQLSSHSVWMNAGGMYRFDAALATAIGGYTAGAVVQTNDGRSAYISTIDNNAADPNTDRTGWEPYAGLAMVKAIRLAQYGVGDVYMTTTDHADAAAVTTYFGGGTWERYAEARALVGVGSTVDGRGETVTVTGGQEFGAATIIQTGDQVGAHAHPLKSITGAGDTDHTGPDQKQYQNNVAGIDDGSTYINQAQAEVQPMSITQPSKGTYFWVRIADPI